MGFNKYDWKKISQIEKARANPLAFDVKTSHEFKILLNEQDITLDLTLAAWNLSEGKFYEFGKNIGNASVKVLEGQKILEEEKKKNESSNKHN